MRMATRKVATGAAAAAAMFSVMVHGQAPVRSAGPGQPPDSAASLSFDVASVKRSDPNNPERTIRRQPGGAGLNTTNTPVRFLITFAYQLQDYQVIGGPSWIDKDPFDIAARLENQPPPPAVPSAIRIDPMMLAMRSLLAERFKLVGHRETREMDVYALVLAKPGGKPAPALTPAPGDCVADMLAARKGVAAPPPTPAGAPRPICGMEQQAGRIRLGGSSLAYFANRISGQVGRAVIDRTGLSGNWSFELKFAPTPSGLAGAGSVAATTVDNLPNFFTALEEQLGLKLESSKGPVEVLVIDSVQQPTPD
jgi:bla regulator protein blaR1